MPGSLSRLPAGAQPPSSQGAQAAGGGPVLWPTVPAESQLQPPDVRVQQWGIDSATVTVTGPGTPSGHAQDRRGGDCGHSAGPPGEGRQQTPEKHSQDRCGGVTGCAVAASSGCTEGTPRQVGNSTSPVASIAAAVGHLWLQVSPARVDRARRHIPGTLAGSSLG